MDYQRIIEISNKLDVSNLKKLKKSELIEYIIQSNLLTPNDRRFNCHIITDGVKVYRAIKGKFELRGRFYKYMICDVVRDFDKIYESYIPISIPSYLTVDPKSIEELREPENYDDYLKKHGL